MNKRRSRGPVLQLFPEPGKKGINGGRYVAYFHCRSCEITKEVPDRFLGKNVKCPKCGHAAMVTAEEEDLGLDEVMDEMVPLPDEPSGPTTATFDLAAETAPPPPPKRPVHILQGNPLKNILAGLATGLLGLIFCLSFASLVFPDGGMAAAYPHILTMALVSAALVGLWTALWSDVGFTIAGPESAAVLVVSLMAAGIQSGMNGMYPVDEIYATVICGVAVACAVAGLVLFASGWAGGGVWIRFIPFQAIGGVLAGVGWFILAAAYTVATNGQPCLPQLTAMSGLDWCAAWLPALALALALFLVLRKRQGTLLMLAIILVGAGAVHGWLFYTHTDPVAAARAGWLFAPFPMDTFWTMYDHSFLTRIHFKPLVDNAGYMVALAGLMVSTIMFKTTELEIVTGRQLNLDRELQGLGLANIVTGLAGGLPGSVSLGRSLGSRAIGAGGPIAGMTAALVCAAAVPFIHQIMPWVPRMLAAGVLGYVGLSLIFRWLVDTRTQFTRGEDYSLLVLVFLLTVTLGFLIGMAVGTAMAMMVLVGRYGSVSVVKHVLSGAHFRSNVDRGPQQLAILKKRGGQIHVLRLQGFVFLGTTDALMRLILDRVRNPSALPLRFLLLDFSRISGLDSSVAMCFARLKQLAQDEKFVLIFTNMPFELEQQLEDAGFVLNDPDNNSMTVVSVDYAMEWCEDRILEAEKALSSKVTPLPGLLEPVFPEPAHIPLLMKALKKVRVKKGQHVFHQGDPSDSMYFIEQGMVNVQLELDGNKVLRLKKMGPGTAFGEMGLYTSAPRSASIVAAEDCVLYRLSTKILDIIQDRNPRLVSSIHRFIVHLLAERVAEANSKVRDLMS